MNKLDDNRRVAEQLVELVKTGTTDMAPDVMRVPSAHYLDPTIWRGEIDTLFMRLPLLAGVSAEIPNPGDYKAYDYVGQPLLITRQKDGSLRAMLNVCKHRAMLLAEEGSGNCRRFSCPYHGWTYNADGSLIAVAERSKFGQVEPEELALTQLPVFERHGFIFVVLTPGQEADFENHVGPMADDMAYLNLAGAYFVGTREIQGPNWKVAYDGYLEGYHFAAAHPETINLRTFSNVMQFDAFGPHLRVGYPQRSILEQLGKVAPEKWGECETDGYDFVRTFFPNVSIFAAPEIIQISQMIPGNTPEASRTIMYFLGRDPNPSADEIVKLNEMADFLSGVVEREDYGAGLKVQRGLASSAASHVIFGRNELGNQHFHKWVEYYMSKDKSLPTPVL
ncbi:aromatic ring-hydroxylating oxygenase subunit alpha [Aquisediminimonas sediminicola]|uniref:aromatic ring-hydroxylating oxygenase subunit alpha n=1 Tax=Alteraquisediminimonas sediminicola TaxID=2676787 RepID=UPI001C8EDC85|nr:SRPBCC family protein [Aquisediminimonas sediminicola]